jgi:hypothetical protein
MCEKPPRQPSLQGRAGARVEAQAPMRRGRQDWHGTGAASRPWTRGERRVVARGFLGRLTIAIEPFFVALFFVLPLGMLLRKQEVALLMAPVFALASLAFLIYSIALLVPSGTALLHTFRPIYIVDGYVHYRVTGMPPVHTVAVLSADRRTLGEWPLRERPSKIGDRDLWPVLVEFSPYGGIHKIDGRPTGVLPARIAPLGIGVAHDDHRRATNYL